VSFHEIDVALKPVSELRVISSLSTFEGIHFRLLQSRLDRRYKSFLQRICPTIHQGFFDRRLDLVIQKT
jgi:hypothetical protein